MKIRVCGTSSRWTNCPTKDVVAAEAITPEASDVTVIGAFWAEVLAGASTWGASTEPRGGHEGWILEKGDWPRVSSLEQPVCVHGA